MPTILPARQHYGTVLHKWESPLFSVSEVKYAARAKHTAHANEEAFLVFVKDGICGKQVGRKEAVWTPGSMAFVPARLIQSDDFGSNETIFVLVDCAVSFLDRLCGLGARLDDIALLKGVEIASMGTQLLRELREADSVSALTFESLLLSIFAIGSREIASSRHPRIPSWLRLAKQVVHDRLSESITIESIAKEIGIHPVHLSHEFRRFFKVTPGEYLRRIRVEFAAEQLISTDLALSEIALMSGFADQAHFSRTFKTFTNMTPREFRILRTAKVIRSFPPLSNHPNR